MPQAPSLAHSDPRLSKPILSESHRRGISLTGIRGGALGVTTQVVDAHCTMPSVSGKCMLLHASQRVSHDSRGGLSAVSSWTERLGTLYVPADGLSCTSAGLSPSSFPPPPRSQSRTVSFAAGHSVFISPRCVARHAVAHQSQERSSSPSVLTPIYREHAQAFKNPGRSPFLIAASLFAIGVVLCILYESLKKKKKKKKTYSSPDPTSTAVRPARRAPRADAFHYIVFAPRREGRHLVDRIVKKTALMDRPSAVFEAQNTYTRNAIYEHASNRSAT